MIIVQIEYDSSATVAPVSLESLYNKETLLNLRDAIEPMIGNLFAEELIHVGVRIRPFEVFDEFDESLFITLDITPGLDPNKGIKASTRQFAIAMEEYLDNNIKHGIPFKIALRMHHGATENSVDLHKL